MGPMRAACRFARELAPRNLLDRVYRVQVELYGSLALTGIGHATDRAVLLGLSGNEPASIDPESIESIGLPPFAKLGAFISPQRAPSILTKLATCSFIAASCFLPARTLNIPMDCVSQLTTRPVSRSTNAHSFPSAADSLPRTVAIHPPKNRKP